MCVRRSFVWCVIATLFLLLLLTLSVLEKKIVSSLKSSKIVESTHTAWSNTQTRTTPAGLESEQIGDENNFAPLSVHSPFSLLFVVSSCSLNCVKETHNHRHEQTLRDLSWVKLSIENFHWSSAKEKRRKKLIGNDYEMLRTLFIFHSPKCEMESEIFTKSLLLTFLNNYFRCAVIASSKRAVASAKNKRLNGFLTICLLTTYRAFSGAPSSRRSSTGPALKTNSAWSSELTATVASIADLRNASLLAWVEMVSLSIKLY